MKRIRIDFAPPSLRRTLFRTPRAGWALAYAGRAPVPAAGLQRERLPEIRTRPARPNWPHAARNVVAPSVIVAAPRR